MKSSNPCLKVWKLIKALGMTAGENTVAILLFRELEYQERRKWKSSSSPEEDGENEIWG